MASDRPEALRPGPTWPGQHPNAPAPGERGMGPYPQQARMQLTAEEKKALKECSTESFWFRCVPLGVLLVGTTQMLVNRGMLNAHPRYGAMLKNMGAGMVAYLVGKMSYQGKCREKILRLENSPLADAMRRGGRQGRFQDLTAPFGGQAQSSSPEFDAVGPDSSKLRESGVNKEIDVDYSRRDIKGLDESLRPSLDSDTHFGEKAKQVPSHDTSYQELRKRNREEYSSRMASQMSPPSPPAQGRPDSSDMFSPPSSDREPLGGRRPSYPSPQSKPGRVRTNQYGDVIEDID